MKLKLVFSLALGGALFASAQQSFNDGVDYYRADRFDDARIILGRVLNESGTDKAAAYYYIGMSDLRYDELDKAEQAFQNGVNANPKNPFNYVGLGAIALKKGNEKEAEAKFKEAKSLDKNNPELLTDVARAYSLVSPVKYQNKIESWIKDAKKASKMKSPAPYILEADLMVDPGQAAAYYEMAWNYDDKHEFPEAYVKYADKYFAFKDVPQNVAFAIQCLKNMQDVYPNSALAQRELAEKYYENNQLTLAFGEYQKLLQNPSHLQKDEQRYVGLLFFAKDYQGSYDQAKKILDKDPNNFYMQRMAFLTQAALENNQQAAEYAKVFFNNPAGQGEFVGNDYSTYGTVLFANGDTVNAIAAMEKAIEIQPNKPEHKKELGLLYTRMKDFENGAYYLQQYVDSAENVSANDLLYLANDYNNAFAQTNDDAKKKQYLDQALVYIDKVIERAPNNYSPYSIKANVMLRQNNQQLNNDIVNVYKQALSVLDQDPANKTDRKSEYVYLYNTLGNYYNQQGDRDTASSYYAKSLQLDPNQPGLSKYLNK